MKVCAISDLHGYLDFNIDKSDILLICGDIVPPKIQNYHKPSKKWFTKDFMEWIDKQPVEEVFIVAGNHDWFIEHHRKEFEDILLGSKCHYLQDSGWTYTDDLGNSYLIWGSPWCHQFGNWSFMGYGDEGLLDLFRKMPDNVDILLTHDASYGCNDEADDYQGHIGNKSLRKVVLEKSPRYQFTGHLHSVDHSPYLLGKTIVQPVSILSNSYLPIYEPTYYDIIAQDFPT